MLHHYLDMWREDFPRERTWAAWTAVRAVMLSAAKHLDAHRARCFAALSMTSRGSRQPQSWRGGVTSSLFAAWTTVLEELLSMLISTCLITARQPGYDAL